MAKLRLFMDPQSEPSRAVYLFCLINKIDVDVHLVSLAKGEQKTQEYRSVNPMGQVPAINDGGFLLFESHAILRYLATAYPGVPDHWYPVEAKKRAQVDCVLDWHHGNLRRGTVELMVNGFYGPSLGLPMNAEAAAAGETLLKKSLLNLETIWLKGNGGFIISDSEPSIADLSLASEIMQLQYLGHDRVNDLLGPRTKVRSWLHELEEATKPHFTIAHEALLRSVAEYRKRDQKQVVQGSVEKEKSLTIEES